VNFRRLEFSFCRVRCALMILIIIQFFLLMDFALMIGIMWRGYNHFRRVMMATIVIGLFS